MKALSGAYASVATVIINGKIAGGNRLLRLICTRSCLFDQLNNAFRPGAHGFAIGLSGRETRCLLNKAEDEDIANKWV